MLTVVTPTEHLKHQWAQAAAEFGMAIDSAYRNAQGRAGADFAGVAVTYAQVAAHPALHRQRTQNRRTLVIFDEIHHAGDALSWGDAIREAFDPARRRLALTGTPFRTDANPIPFVTYAQEAGWGAAQRLGLRLRLRPRARGRRGPAGDLPCLLRRDALAYPGRRRDRGHPGHADDQGADGPCVADRAGPGGGVGQPGARGRGQAADRGAQGHARRGRPGDRGRPRGRPGLRRAAARGDRQAPGAWCCPTTRPRARRSPRSPTPEDRWMVAVRMVSEGVDIPRLAVGVYATSVSTALFFAQAVGRFVRARRRGETASVFLPSVPVLLTYAAELEAERDHILRPARRVRPRRRNSPRPSASATPPTPWMRPRPSSPSTRPRTSTGCCTTAASSAPPPPRAPPRRKTSWACPAC